MDISNQKLTITCDNVKKTARCIVSGKVGFTDYEMSQMKLGTRFKLKCELKGADSGLNGKDDFLYTYVPVKYFPDSTSTQNEDVTFEVVLGEGVLDEDNGVDDVYGSLTLTNLYTTKKVTKYTSQVSHSF